jgi:AraC-like DNA-binding protein
MFFKEIALIGIAQTLFFSLLIVFKPKKEIKDYFLFVFFLFVGAELFYRYLRVSVSLERNTWIAIFDIIYWALFGPLTLFYIDTVIGKIKRIKSIHLLHLIPLLIGFLAVKDLYFGNTHYTSFVDYFLKSKGLNKVLLFLWEFISPAYMLYCLFILIRYQKKVKGYFSNVSGKSLKWMLVLVCGFVLHMAISYTAWILQAAFHVEVNNYYFGFIPVAFLVVYVFFLGFYGYRQSGIFFEIPKSSSIISSSKKKYFKSGLTEGERNNLMERLNEVMRLKKPYLECDLTISNLASLIDTDIHKLSQVINGSFNKNFYDYVNSFRIEESKRLLSNPESEKYKIISIAWDSGFSTKSSFYNAFRKNTGLTPGEYQEKIKKSHSNAILN